MANFHYDGEKVNSGVSKLNHLTEDLQNYSNGLYSATKNLVSARGFEQYVGGISAGSFSCEVENFTSGLKTIIDEVRTEQIQILNFSQNTEDIKLFLSSLTDEEQKKYDLEELDILKDRSSNIFKRAGASLAVTGLGIVEGLGNFLETGADLLVMAGCGIASIFTAGFDLLTGRKGDNSITKRLWDWCQGYCADKKVESIFNKFYTKTDVGRSLKANAYAFDGFRNFGKGIGYVAGMVGLTVLTGGISAGGFSATNLVGSISSTRLAVTAGIMGFSSGTSDAWSDGATVLDGFKYGLAKGAWEGTQWYLGAKINTISGVGKNLASPLAQSLVDKSVRIGLDTVDAAAGSFIQPAMKMLYKYDNNKSFGENYGDRFEEAGGWGNVATQTAIGAAVSGVSETFDLRKLLKDNKEFKASGTSVATGTTTTAAAVGTVAATSKNTVSNTSSGTARALLTSSADNASSGLKTGGVKVSTTTGAAGTIKGAVSKTTTSSSAKEIATAAMTNQEARKEVGQFIGGNAVSAVGSGLSSAGMDFTSEFIKNSSSSIGKDTAGQAIKATVAATGSSFVEETKNVVTTSTSDIKNIKGNAVKTTTTTTTRAVAVPLTE